jgi:DNA-3-methyladenine glycosylase
MGRVLPPDFYDRNVVEVAIELLGMLLVSRTREGMAAGRIVEVEAYLSRRDTACHASRGRTPGNAAMFGNPGTAYVYPIHSRCCFNAVTQPKGEPSAVLVRAIEPCRGEALMERRRGEVAELDLARGPGRLCEALGIGRDKNQHDLTAGRGLWIEQPPGRQLEEAIYCSPRIGVSRAQDRYLRFFLLENRYVSGPRRPAWKRPVKHQASARGVE